MSDLLPMARELLHGVLSFDAASPLLFTQFYFWAFFALVFAGFSLLGRRLFLRNIFLFAASAFFYYKTSGLCLLILLFCTLSDFCLARRIHRASTPGGKKAFLGLSLLINLLLLAFFKYSYFVVDVVNTIAGTEWKVFNVFAWVGNQGGGTFRVDHIVLPVGISFYIFQTISYTMDVYRGRIEPLDRLLDYGFYVSFFPQLVAGPIVRASVFIPQIYKPYHLSRRQFGLAVFWILNGLIKKLVLSDYLAVNFVDRVFGNPSLFTGFENLSALFLYSLQVYADFSGYTDIAIGVASLMGFRLPQNFNSPYKATNAGQFWKRWHISLSRWLQDYLYIPLGGSRKATFGTYFCLFAMAAIGVALSHRWWVGLLALGIWLMFFLPTIGRPQRRLKLTTDMNVLNTMLLGGLWHGASLNFVIWGGLNGFGVLVSKTWKTWSPLLRMLVCLCLFATAWAVETFWTSSPLLRIALVWTAVLTAGCVIRFAYAQVEARIPGIRKGFFNTAEGMGKVWGVLQTFTFITFTRLFFRSGSNLDPAQANREAWRTATDMIRQIGGQWDMSLIPDMVSAYREVLLLFGLGMVIHWLPDRLKRRYRLWFAAMPLWFMALVVTLVVVLLHQFVSSDLQAFIYFQF